jgi:hypothetical protein
MVDLYDRYIEEHLSYVPNQDHFVVTLDNGHTYAVR